MTPGMRHSTHQKRYRSLAWSFVLLTWLLLQPGASHLFAQFAGGDGSVGDPYQVSNLEQLQAIRGASNTAHFILINDIDASASAGMNGGQGFNPVGWFGGSLDGQHHTISNLVINRPGSYQQALFSQSGSDASFSNIHFENVSVTGGNRAAALVGTLAGSATNISVSGSITGAGTVGSVAGQIDSGGSVSLASSSATVSGSGDYVGGLVGLINSGSSVHDSGFYGSVSGASRVGGLAGQANSGSNVTGNSVDATVNGSGNRIGGLIGYNNQANLVDNETSGSVSGNDEVGGLVGRNESAGRLFTDNHSSANVIGSENVGGLIGYINGGIIEVSSSSGTVRGTTNVGGLAGFAGFGNALIRLSFSSSNVMPAPGGGNRNQFGGLVGGLQSGTIENSFALGDVVGNNRVGGLVGENRWGSIVNSFSTGNVNPEAGQSGGMVGRDQGGSTTNSFWDVETSGFNDSAAGTGKTTAQMNDMSTFTNAGWDFQNIWSIDPAINDGYPFLRAFFPVVEGDFFSRQNGPWNDPDTWAIGSHSGPAAGTSPGAGHNATIGENHTVTLTADVNIGDGSTLVNNTGALVTQNHILSGSGHFTLAAGGTLHIGSAEGIRSAAAAGNIQTGGSRSFSQQASYVYDGITAQQTGDGLPVAVNKLRIDNGQGVTRFGSLRVNGQLQLDNGVFTMSPGSSLVANNVDQGSGNIRMQLTIDGLKGWRMISSPVGTTYGDLFEGFVTQGFTGSEYPNLQPNILWFDEEQIGTTNMAWRAPQNISDPMAGGRGHFFYVFDGAGMPNGQGSYPDELPITMDATGLEFATGGSVFDFNLTHTPRSEEDISNTDIVEMNTGWNLVGNPSTASLNWNSSGWTKENVDESIYVWDPATESFLVWNGENGNSGSTLIAPFQAFWVRANDEGAILRMNDEVKTTGGSFVGGDGVPDKEEDAISHMAIGMQLSAANRKTTSFISFNHEGSLAEDRYDAYQLEPMSDSWVKLYTSTREHGMPMVINNLPFKLERLTEIPVYVEGQENLQGFSGPYSFRWRLPDSWPASWLATLMDHENKTAIPMGASGGVDHFTVDVPKGAWASTPVGQELSPPANIIGGQTGGFPASGHPWKPRGFGNTTGGVKTAEVNTGPRFSIVITPGTATEHPGYMAPEASILPVYPNPVSNRASIRFSLPEEAFVSIEVYDLQGRLLQELVSQVMPAGVHSTTWTPHHNLANGIYLAVMRTKDGKQHQKMILAR